MALNSALIVVALFLLAAASPPAHGALLKAATIQGRICCTANGTCPSGATGVSGVLVTLHCTNLVGATVTIANGTTDVNGNFNISVPNIVSTLGSVTSVLGGTLPCTVSAKLPLSRTVCPVLSTTTGVLSAVPILVGTLLSPVLGLVGNFLAPLCLLVIAGPGK